MSTELKESMKTCLIKLKKNKYRDRNERKQLNRNPMTEMKIY